MLDSGLAHWQPPQGPPTEYEVLKFRPSYAETAKEAPLYKEMADIKAQLYLFQAQLIRKPLNQGYQYGLLFQPWRCPLPLTTFPQIEDQGSDPLWFLQKPKPRMIIRDLGPPQDKPDKYKMNQGLLSRIGYMEVVALQQHLTKRHKSCPPLIEAPRIPDRQSGVNAYLTSRRVTAEWQVQLWAQRTGELFIPGGKQWSPDTALIPATSPMALACPLCQKATNNLSLHWMLNCSHFQAQYQECAEKQWQVVLQYLRRILSTTPPTHAVFAMLRDPDCPHAREGRNGPHRLKAFWYMDGRGTPTLNFIGLLLSFKKPYETLILDLQRLVAKTNKQIIEKGSKTLGAYQCTTLDAC